MQKLAYIIWILHVLIAAFVVITPFVNAPRPFVLLHAVVVPALLLHWYLNNNVCFLTWLEQHLRGVDESASFFHSLVSPVYSLPSSLDAISGKLIWILTIAVGALSWHQLYGWYKEQGLIGVLCSKCHE